MIGVYSEKRREEKRREEKRREEKRSETERLRWGNGSNFLPDSYLKFLGWKPVIVDEDNISGWVSLQTGHEAQL